MGSAKKFQSAVAQEMRKFKKGKLHSGSKKGPIVKKRKQAIAIALNSAREKGLGGAKALLSR